MKKQQTPWCAIALISLGFQTVKAQQTGWIGEKKQTTLSAPTKFLLTQALAQGRKDIPVLVAADKGTTLEVEQLIRRAGGTVLTAIPEIGYIHATLPVDQAWWMIRQPAVTDLAIAGNGAFRDDLSLAKAPVIVEARDQVGTAPAAQAAGVVAPDWRYTGSVDLSLPLLLSHALETTPGLNANSYLQQRAWLGDHPSWDGRGVTIVSAEDASGVDHPALQTALNLQGNPVRKIAGIIDANDYTHPDMAGAFQKEFTRASQVDFSTNARLEGGTACPKPEIPGAGVGVVHIHQYEVRDNYCVEWDPHLRVAHVDLNRNGSFADDLPLRDFNQSGSFIVIPFTARVNDGQLAHHLTATLSYDDASGTVLIVSSAGDHSAMTATAAAATGYLGTNIGGVAPGARLMFLRGSADAASHIEGAWKALSRPDTDLLTSSTELGGDCFPSESRTLATMFLDRIGTVTGKPMLVAAGNWGLPFEQSYGRGRLVIDVGGYISRDQLQLFRYNNGSLAAEDSADYVYDGNGGSSAGPGADGGFGVDILTPEKGIAGANCGSDHYTGRPEAAQVGLSYRLPPCYSISDGTSTSTPRAAGAVALLLSAAKQEHLRITPEMVKNALIVSARFLPNEPVYRQGPGLLQVTDAWNALREAAQNPPVRILSSTPDLVSLYPQYWRGALTGQGIYVTRGFHPGLRKRVTLDLSAEGIAADRLSFDLVGNDGTFEVASTQTERDGKIRVFLNALAASTGNKNALIEVRAKGRKYPLARLPILMAATPAPGELRAGITMSGTLQLPSSRFILFEPPPGTVALEIVGSAQGSPLRMGFVMGTNPALTYNANHGQQETEGPLVNERRRFILPLLHPDLVGMTIVNEQFGKEPCCRSEYAFTVRALMASDIAASVTADTPLLAVVSKKQIESHAIRGTLASTADLSIPDDVDAVVVSFPQVAFDPARPFATEAYLYDPAGNEQGLWNYYPVIDKGTRLAVPKPRGGTWKLVLLGSSPGYDAGPITMEFLRKVATTDSLQEHYVSLGALCKGAACSNTWPLDNSLWRYMPLLHIPNHAGGLDE